MTATMVDVAFPLVGSALPREHRRALADALVAALPWLADLPRVGVHRIKVAAGVEQRALLSGRSRLTLRVPHERVQALATLVGGRLDVAGEIIDLPEAPVVRELLPHGTLYAYAVHAQGAGEIEFLDTIDTQLAALGVSCRRFCGRAQTVIDDEGGASSYSLMLDGLSAADSLRVLEAGLGSHRLWGCGVFVPHRSAAAVGS